MISIINVIKKQKLYSFNDEKCYIFFYLGNNSVKPTGFKKLKLTLATLSLFSSLPPSDSISAFAKVNLRFRTEEDFPSLCKLFYSSSL